MCRFAWQAPDFTKGVFIIIQDPGCMACRHPIHTFHSPTSHSRSSNKRLRFHDMDFPWQHLLRYLSPILHPAFPVTVPNGTFLPWRIRIFLISSTKKSLPKGKSWQTPCGVRGYGTVLSSGGIIDADRFKNLRKSKRNQSGWNKNVSRRHAAKLYIVYHGVLEHSALLTKNSTKWSVVKKLSQKARAIKSCEKRTLHDKYRHQENLQWKAQKVNISQRSTWAQQDTNFWDRALKPCWTLPCHSTTGKFASCQFLLLTHSAIEKLSS